MILVPNTLIHNRYKIVRLIGKGGMGAVYEALDERLSNPVALKQTLVIDDALLNIDTDADIDSQYIASIRRAFEREAKMLAGLRHHTLPKVIDYFTDDQGQFLVMEFIPGDDLSVQLHQRQGPFPYNDVLRWTDQLLDVLDYLHTQHNPIIHRDIKPQNLKLTARNEIILLDFGLAKGSTSVHTRLATTSSIFGYTQQYAPLEQIRGTGTDPRSDLYSLGATIYHLLTGTLPVDALGRVDAIVGRRPDPLRSLHELNAQVPEAMSAVLMRALELSIDDRPPSAAVLRADLHAARQDAPEVIDVAPGTHDVSEPELLAYYETVAYPRRSDSSAAVPLDVSHSDATEAVATQADQTRPAAEQVAPPGRIIGKVLRPGRLPQWLAIGGIGIVIALIITGVGLSRGVSVDPSVSPVVTSQNNRPDPAVVAAETTTARARATTQAEHTAEAVAQATTRAEQTAEAVAQATTRAEQTAAAAVQATATALAGQLAVIAAEAPQRAARHLSGELGNATSQYNPGVEAALLQNGYAANLINIGGVRGLQPSQSEPTRHTWVRDLDYAVSGYGYVLGDMSALRENIELFLADVEPNGIVPDVYNAQSGYGLNQAWDSMPNLIHAVYVYVARTADWDFYRENRQKCLWIGEWITGLDTDGNGLPDRDVYPYGYYNSIENSVQHTYALAKFYAAYNDLAALERIIGEDGSGWEQRAVQLREAFHRPYDQGGYWRDDLAWPVSWRDSSQQPVRTLETFGVFEAVRSGLIAPADPGYQKLMLALSSRLPDLMVGPAPLRLTLDGYPSSLLRPVVREPWKADASAPWIVGLAAPAYAAAGYPDQAAELLAAYTDAAGSDALVWQLVATDGSGREGRGGAWGSAAWFMAVYNGHYGLELTPAALIVEPHPFATIADDGVQNLSYQGATIQLRLDRDKQTYWIQVDQLTSVILRPMANASQVRVNGELFGREAAIVLDPGLEHVVTSES